MRLSKIRNALSVMASAICDNRPDLRPASLTVNHAGDAADATATEFARPRVASERCLRRSRKWMRFR